MKKLLSGILSVLTIMLSANSLSAQSTFTRVYNLLQANCGTANCHVSGNAPVFSVEGAQNDVYASLVDALPVNTAASAKGYKLVDPGHPYNSFLLNKIGSEFDPYLALGDDMGERMPKDHGELEDYDIELVRQWILMGAPQTGTKVDYQLLVDYYTNGGIDMIPVPQAPDPSAGMQVRFGPIFLAPDEEVEWDKKEHLRNDAMMKVFKTDGYMSWQSHHMLLFKYDGDGSGVREGMRLVPSEAFPFNGDVTLTGAWQNDAEFELPERTAFYWGPNTVLDFDYHIKNYSHTEILPSDFYLNIYWDTQNTRDIQMHAQLANNLALLLFQGENTRVASDNFNEDRYIYMMSSHAHQWGTDFDIYMKNANGTRGSQIYEGFFNENYTFNQGYYDWEHPPIRYYNPMPKVSHGLEYETKYNVGVPFVTFGLTADDEMMLFTYLYTKEEVPQTPTAIAGVSSNNIQMSVSPNPLSYSSQLAFSVDENSEIAIEVFDMLGKKVSERPEGTMQKGNHRIDLDAAAFGGSGVYFITLRVNGAVAATRKVVVE